MLTKPPAEMIRATGDIEQTEIKVKNGFLAPEVPIGSNVSEVETATYDEIQGILTLIFVNGQQILVSGFPTQNSLLPGPTGPQGPEGNPGAPGQDGRHGERGPTGCTGPMGIAGPQGPVGVDGRDGAEGPQGPQGPIGPTGPMGPVGPTGPQGPVGPQGQPGTDGAAGPAGPAGPMGTINVVISTADPGASIGAGGVWINPNADGDVGEPGGGGSGDGVDPPPGSIVWP